MMYASGCKCLLVDAMDAYRYTRHYYSLGFGLTRTLEQIHMDVCAFYSIFHGYYKWMIFTWLLHLDDVCSKHIELSVIIREFLHSFGHMTRT